MGKTTEWPQLSDEELLQFRICDLGLTLESPEIQERVGQLYAELAAKEQVFRPHIYLGDEWFSPEGMLAISIPFYLAHPRLKALEKRMMLEVEGGTPEWFQRLLRHEAGHCFDHTYRFSKRRKWQKIFGSPDEEYAPETYHPKPYSKSFVQHLDNWYAQAHPDEDFAETFAVWLGCDADSAIDWRKQYRNWPGALQKLEYIEELAQEAKTLRPFRTRGNLPCMAIKSKMTLQRYYARRKKENATDYPDFYDGDLKNIFNGEQSLNKKEFGAARFLKRRHKSIVDSVSFWSGEKKFPIETLIKKFVARCETLDLRIGKSEEDTLLNLSAYLATLVNHYLFTGKFKRSV